MIEVAWKRRGSKTLSSSRLLPAASRTLLANRTLYLTVFISGMSTLAIELAAARLLGAIFGTSNLVWASIIGLILIYLTIGYFLGGRWADQRPSAVRMYSLLAWGAFSAGFVPLVAKPILPLAAAAFDSLNVGVLAGSFAGVLILFSVPVTLLGTISPFAIRLALRRPGEAGTISGRIYAISTLGSFVGTFLPVLVLIPLIGTTLTFLFFSLLLLGTAYLGLWQAAGFRRVLLLAWMPAVLLVAVWLWGDTPFKRTAGQILELESAYNYIEVLQRDGYTLLRLNEGQGIHSVYHPDELNYYGPWELFLVAPYFNAGTLPAEVGRIGIVGLAAGTSARQLTEVYGALPIDGWEIDPAILKIGRDYFGMTMPNLNAIAQDGRWGLASSPHHYSVIEIDAYRPPYIPWHLTTLEFFQIVHDRLTEEGVLVINIGRAPGDRRLIDGLAATIGALFPSLYVVDVPNSFNSIIYATRQSSDIQGLYENYAALQYTGAHPLLLAAVATAVTNLQPTPSGKTVFTDDRAPIEWMTNNLVLNFLLSGGTDSLAP